ncbi:BRO1-like domain-domain-containing protein [Kockovaella imperatae]|uniref:BRO1-like domain-domain-containing protein n=1 Tax=Kockovaella imperatae TaxID=4999 RepID=A0A1Y1UJR7_9TREE|nr:BRO1-like domain-domain-containing protein [Kockovaella imperatae]ORX38229.1 BRO1-like domain-domain-containing protein [Kockovaella imperatae]
MSNFLPIPSKRATPLSNLSSQLLSYISNHFRDAHPDAFRKDVDTLVGMRRELVETKPEAHPEIVKGLMRYHAQLAFLMTKFPSDIGVNFAFHLPFPPLYSLTPDASISLPSLSFERASVLFNIAALYASMAASERRAEVDGIKRALGYLSSAAGVLDHLIQTILPLLQVDLAAPTAAGYDLTPSFLGALKEFLLAEAQECFWQQAVIQGTYKNAVIGKLSMKVSDYYKAALASANDSNGPSIGFFPANWVAHITIKQMHFEAAAQYRLSQEDLEKNRYGEEIARLRVAEGLTKKGLDMGKSGVAEAVVQDMRSLQGAVKSALERAVRDNDLVYVKPVPPATQLTPIQGAGMVKLAVPVEIGDPIAWLMGGSSGTHPLFTALVPYGVHLALSIYDDRRDTLIRELDGKREELDGLAASTLQSLNLPGAIQALERRVGLPPSLLRKAEEVDSSGGVQKITSLLAEVQRLSTANSRIFSEAMDILDQEAHETENLKNREPHRAASRVPSHIANQHLIAVANQYEGTMKQAGASDITVREKWEEWEPLIRILAGGEDDLNDHIPSVSGTTTVLPTSVRPLRASLEDLDDQIAHRATLIVEAKQIAANDDVRPDVLKEATRLAHGGSGDVKTEWFESIFDKGLGKYDEIKSDMRAAETKQEAILATISEQNAAFLRERKDDPRVRDREHKLQQMDTAYWKWREVVDNAEEGIKFYNRLSDLLVQFKGNCIQFLNSRRADVGQLTSALQHASISSPPPQSSSASSYSSDLHSLSASPPPPQSPPKSFSIAHPSSSVWTSSADLLPPPPPQPILRSGGVPAPQQPISVRMEDSPRRVTRSSTRGPIGDAEKNPYSSKSGRKTGGGVV